MSEQVIEDSKQPEKKEFERTLILIKPDAVKAKTTGLIINDLLALGEISAMEMVHKSSEFIAEHYHDHRESRYFKDLVAFVSSGKLIFLVLEGNGVIKSVRDALGEVGKGGLRGKYGTSINMNAIHASDSPVSAARELDLWLTTKL
jgi:nucleoside-diphosphate kinase